MRLARLVFGHARNWGLPKGLPLAVQTHMDPAQSPQYVTQQSGAEGAPPTSLPFPFTADSCQWWGGLGEGLLQQLPGRHAGMSLACWPWPVWAGSKPLPSPPPPPPPIEQQMSVQFTPALT